VNELESEEGDSQRQKSSFPAQRIGRWCAEEESGNEVPVLKDAEHSDADQDADEAGERTRPVEVAEQRLPDEDQHARRAPPATELSCREIDEETDAKGRANPRTQSGWRDAKENRGREEKEQIVDDRVEYQGRIPLAESCKWTEHSRRRVSGGDE
jgi:hypothetical protein